MTGGSSKGEVDGKERRSQGPDSHGSSDLLGDKDWSLLLIFLIFFRLHLEVHVIRRQSIFLALGALLVLAPLAADPDSVCGKP